MDGHGGRWRRARLRAPSPVVTAPARRQPRLVLAMVLALVAALAVAVVGPGTQAIAGQAGAGDLDPSFDEDGITITEIGSDVTVVDTAVQTLAGGEQRLLVLAAGAEGRLLWRLLPDGSLDTTFDDDGVLPVSSTFEAGTSSLVYFDQVATSADGGIVLVGDVLGSVTGPPIGARRLLPDGATDTDFGTDGDIAIEATILSMPAPPECLPSDDPDAIDPTQPVDLEVEPELVVDAAGHPAAGADAVVVVLSGDVTTLDIEVIDEGGSGYCYPDEALARGAIVLQLDATGMADGGAAPLISQEEDMTPGGMWVREDRILVTAATDAPSVEFDPPQAVVAVAFRTDLGLDPDFGVHGMTIQQQALAPWFGLPDLSVAEYGGGRIATVAQGLDEGWLLLRLTADGFVLDNPPPEPTEVPWPDDTTAAVIGVQPVTGNQVVVAARLTTMDAPGTVGLTIMDAEGDVSSSTQWGAPGGEDTAAPKGLATLGNGSLRVVGEVAGAVDDLSFERLAMSRLTPAGAFDESFGPTEDGFVTHNGGASEEGRATAVRPDRKVLAAGTIFFPYGDGEEPDRGFVFRRLEDGPLDEPFSPDPPAGIGITDYPLADPDYPSEPLAVDGMALDAEQRPILVGHSGLFFSSAEPSEGAIVRLTPDDDTIDPGFNDGAMQSVAEATQFHDVAVDGEGRIVAVGERRNFQESVSPLVVVRLLPDGTPDPDFGPDGNGVVEIRPESVQDADSWAVTGQGVAIDADGRIVLTGSLYSFLYATFESSNDLIVARLLDDGSGDTTFATDPDLGAGVRRGPADHYGNDVAVDGNDILVVGDYYVRGGSEASAAATPSGAGAGPVIAVAGVAAPLIAAAAAVPDGYVEEAFVARLGADATLDTDFGTDGITTPFTDASELSNGTSLAIDTMGQVVVVGSSRLLEDEISSSEDVDLLLGRLLPDGTLDPVFGTDGVVTTDLGLEAGEAAEDVALAPDGKIVVAGHVTDDRSTRIMVNRYLPGSPSLDCVPDPADFGSTEVDTTTSLVITCTAVDGRVEVTALAIDDTAPDKDDFAIDTEDCVGTTLGVDESCTATIDFTPSNLGPRSAGLVADFQTVEGPDQLSVGLIGTGELTPDPSIVVEPDPVVFPERLVATTSPSSVVTVTNTGNVPLSVTSTTVTGADSADFDVVGTSCAGVLAPAASCTIDVTFTPRPGAGANRAAGLRVTDSATGSPSFVALQGSMLPATLVVDPGEGPIETEVEVTGTGFESGVAVTIRVSGVDVATVPGGQVVGGGFTFTIEIPPGTPGGDQPVFACQRCGTARRTSASTPFTVTPRLFVDPPIGAPGAVVLATGDGFEPDVEVVLTWSRGIGATLVVPDDAGEIESPVLVFQRDIVGDRILEATPTGESEPVAEVDFLAVPGTVVPGDFAVRR